MIPRTTLIAGLAAFAACLAAGPPVLAGGPITARKALTLDGAKLVAAAASAEARRLDAGGAIAVVDDGGSLLYLERLENTFPAAATVALEKARTAATFRRPTRDFENAIARGRTSLVAVDVMTPLQGGVPLIVEGAVVGAVGVSGAASAQQDDDIAAVAASAAAVALSAAAADPVTYISAEKTRAAFAAGMPLIETAAYKVHASRREKPGLAELHERDTDIIYVLEGTATLVTGGTVAGGKQTAADERRGEAISGGETRVLVKGDLVVVPDGTPHQFTAVSAPFLYYVVKVATGGRR
jgi:uncharacterized protein GlcG (DUF336 family)